MNEETYLREGTAEDYRFLFDLRNDRLVRQNSFHHDPVAWEDHCRWYQNLLDNPHRHQFVLIKAEQPVGQVRIDVEEGVAEIGYSICSNFRGQGLGTEILQLLEEKTREDLRSGHPRYQANILLGRVIPGNEASKRVFRKLGYQQMAETPDFVEFQKRV